MTKTRNTFGVCPKCGWKGEESEFLHALKNPLSAKLEERPVCPECQALLKLVKIQSVTVPFSKTDKPKTVEAEQW